MSRIYMRQEYIFSKELNSEILFQKMFKMLSYELIFMFELSNLSDRKCNSCKSNPFSSVLIMNAEILLHQREKL